MLSISGKKLPSKLGTVGNDYSLAIALALRQDVGDSRRSIKTLMKWTGACERTVQNWLSGVRGPSGQDLIALTQNSKGVFVAFLLTANRRESQPRNVGAAVALILEALSLLEDER